MISKVTKVKIRRKLWDQRKEEWWRHWNWRGLL